MERFKNSSYIALYAGLVTSVIGFSIFVIFIYAKNPLEMPNEIIGLLTILPFVVFFGVSILLIPIIVIPIRKRYLIASRPFLKGVYEILLYFLYTILAIMIFDVLYQYVVTNVFSENFAIALKSALTNTENNFSNREFDSFSRLPFLVQNIFVLLLGLMIAGVISYPVSISIANRLSKNVKR